MKHPELIELLPWYANATLDDAERQAVKEHLAGCPECVRELERLMQMRQATLELAEETPEPSPFLLNRALAQIEDYERTKAPVRRESAPLREPMKAWWPRSPFFVRAALATQFAIMLALGIVAVYQHNHPQAIYITSSGASGESARAGIKISVMFSPDATEREISQT